MRRQTGGPGAKRGRGGKNLTQLVRRERKMKSVPAREAMPEE